MRSSRDAFFTNPILQCSAPVPQQRCHYTCTVLHAPLYCSSLLLPLSNSVSADFQSVLLCTTYLLQRTAPASRQFALVVIIGAPDAQFHWLLRVILLSALIITLMRFSWSPLETMSVFSLRWRGSTKLTCLRSSQLAHPTLFVHWSSILRDLKTTAQNADTDTPTAMYAHMKHTGTSCQGTCRPHALVWHSSSAAWSSARNVPAKAPELPHTECEGQASDRGSCRWGRVCLFVCTFV